MEKEEAGIREGQQREIDPIAGKIFTNPKYLSYYSKSNTSTNMKRRIKKPRNSNKFKLFLPTRANNKEDKIETLGRIV